MTPFDEFDEFLATQEHNDYWSDVGVLDADQLLHRFDPSDWSALLKTWPNRTVVWQELAAYAMGEAHTFEYSLPILLDMIRHGSANVQLQACDTLRTTLQSQPEPIVVGNDVVVIVESLCGNSTGLFQKSIKWLRPLIKAA